MTISRSLAKAGVGHPCNEIPGSRKKMRKWAAYLFVREKTRGAEQCMQCAVTCVKKESVCVFDCCCVSLAGDPRNRRPNTDCFWEGNWEAGDRWEYPLVSFECQIMWVLGTYSKINNKKKKDQCVLFVISHFALKSRFPIC